MNKEDLRIIFMGTPDFAVQSLKALVENKFNVIGVITMPDKPIGRGHKIQYSAVKEYALSVGLNILQPENLKDETFIQELKNLRPTIQIVVAFRMLPEIVWNMPELGTFNLHASLLPQYRGAAPINWAIINGEKYTGITTFFLKHEIDTGEIILQERVEIEADDDFGTMYSKLKIKGADLVIDSLNLILENKLQTIPQSKLYSTEEILKTAPKIFKDTCKIDWSKSAIDITNFVRGLSPYPLAYTEYSSEGKDLFIKIGKCEVVSEKSKLPIGTIITDGKKYLSVVCGEDIIKILEMQLPGKKMLPIKDILNGYKFDNTNFK